MSAQIFGVFLGALLLLVLLQRRSSAIDREVVMAQIEVLVEAQIRICDEPEKPPMAHLIEIQNEIEKSLP